MHRRPRLEHVGPSERQRKELILNTTFCTALRRGLYSGAIAVGALATTLGAAAHAEPVTPNCGFYTTWFDVNLIGIQFHNGEPHASEFSFDKNFGVNWSVDGVGRGADLFFVGSNLPASVFIRPGGSTVAIQLTATRCDPNDGVIEAQVITHTDDDSGHPLTLRTMQDQPLHIISAAGIRRR
jgi:hypothetical protein